MECIMKFRKNTTQDQDKMYGIIGLGRFGKALALQLAESGKEILVLDADEDSVREIREYTENAFIVKNLDKKTLLETGIQDCDVVVLCIGERIDTSILATLTLTSMGVPHVIAKAVSYTHLDVYKRQERDLLPDHHLRKL